MPKTTKETLINEGQQWVSDLLYETGNVHQREKHIYDKAENKIEDLIAQAHTAGRQERTAEVVEWADKRQKEMSPFDRSKRSLAAKYNTGVHNTLTDIKNHLNE